MSTTIKQFYRASNVGVTITLASLTNTSARSSVAIDNSSNNDLDLLFQLKLKSGSGVSSTGYVNVYAAGSADGGTSYPEGCDGTDKGVTLTIPPNAKMLGRISVVASTTSYISEPMSVAAAFGGTLPDHVCIIVENQSGATFDATGGNFSAFYQAVQAQAV